jgi:hypothetical protein
MAVKGLRELWLFWLLKLNMHIASQVVFGSVGLKEYRQKPSYPKMTQCIMGKNKRMSDKIPFMYFCISGHNPLDV